MKYEILVEYKRSLHPKFDAKVVELVGKEPYNSYLGGNVRSMEFVFDNKADYDNVYKKLSKHADIRVVGGNLR